LVTELKQKELFIMCDTGKKKRSKEEITLELLNGSLRHAEGILVRTVLEEMDWNISRAARELHIPRGTLYSKMQKHDIQRPT
jgi:transcriptional regulator of acetoin/glycerol metabolism